MKLSVFSGRDLQNAFAIYQVFLSEGITDVREMSRRLQGDIDNRIQGLDGSRKVLTEQRIVAVGDDERADVRRLLEEKHQRTARLKEAQKAGYCPECAVGDKATNKKPLTIRLRLSKESGPGEIIYVCPRCRYSELRK